MKFSELPQAQQPAPAAVPEAVESSAAIEPSREVPAKAKQEHAAWEAYGQGISAMARLLERVQVTPVQAYADLKRVVETYLGLLLRGDQELLVLAARSSAENYLWAHSVNVCILSLKVGLGLHAATAKVLEEGDREQLILLGVAALLHDIGMVKWLSLAREPRKLTPDEQQEIKLHSLESRKLLANILDIQKATKPLLEAIIGQTKESLDENGVAQAPPAPQIISLCGVYEALTHYRAWREPGLPNEVVKTLMRQHKQHFDADLFKTFVEQLSFYPPGSFVQISNGEIGRVVGVRVESPTRPLVEVWIRSNLMAQKPPILLDLLKIEELWIERAVDETKIKTEDKQLLNALRGNRWWP